MVAILSSVIFDFNPAYIAGLGVLLGGLGSLVSAVGAMKIQRKHSADECENV
jgi:hypothetical protein